MRNADQPAGSPRPPEHSLPDATADSEAGSSAESELPSFLRESDRTDRIYLILLSLTAIYGFAIIPFRAILLLEHTFLHTWLTGSSLSVLILAAQNSERPWFLALVVVVAALSAIKFAPLFYLIGRKWGPEFITMSFGGYPPKWFQKIENFIYQRPGTSLLAAFIPFSPVPVTIVLAIAGITRTKGWLVAAYIFTFAALNRLFYLYLGLRFGPSIQGTLETIDKYVFYFTLALLAYMFASIWWKNNRAAMRGAKS